MKIISLLVILTLWGLPVLAQGKIAESSSASPMPPIITEQEKEQLSKDAKQLAEDFDLLFKDLSLVGHKVIIAFVDYISNWIRENYDRISDEQREKLKELLLSTKNKFAELEGISTEALLEVLQDITQMFDEFEKDLGKPPNNYEETNNIVI